MTTESATAVAQRAPLWGDASFASVAPALRSGCVVAAVRSASVGMPIEASASAPFTDGQWLLSHNGLVDRAVLPPSSAAESTNDSALLAALIFDRGMDALGDTIAEVAAADPNARLNILAGNGSRTARHHVGGHAVRAAARRRRGAGQRTVRRRPGLAGDPRPPPRQVARLGCGADRAERICMTLSLSNHLAADSAARALRRDVYDGLTQTPKSLPPKWFYDSVGQRSVRSDHQAARVLPDQGRGGDPARPRDRDRRGIGCGHARRARQRDVGEDPAAAQRAARPRIAAPLHPVRRRRGNAAGRKLGHLRRVPGHRDRRRLR